MALFDNICNIDSNIYNIIQINALKPWTKSLENCIDISFIVRQSIVRHFTLTSVLLLLITLSLIFIGRLDIFIARALTHLSRISLVYNSYRLLYTYFDNIYDILLLLGDAAK